MIPQAIEEALLTVLAYVPTNDWVVVKKELLKALPSELRINFSTRDPVTKKQQLNDFERNLIERCRELTGRILILKV